MTEFKKVGVGWLTKTRDGIRGVINETLQSGAKFLIQKNKYKTQDEADAKKPDYILTEIIEDENR